MTQLALRGRPVVSYFFDLTPLANLTQAYNLTRAFTEELILYFFSTHQAVEYVTIKGQSLKSVQLDVALGYLKARTLVEMDEELNQVATLSAHSMQAWLEEVKALVETLDTVLRQREQAQNFEYDYRRFGTVVHQEADRLLQSYPHLYAVGRTTTGGSFAISVLADQWAEHTQREVTCFE